MHSKLNIQHIQNINQPAEYIAEIINSKLQDGLHVVWFISGGSNIPLAVEVRKLLQPLINKGRLDVFLIDERFGEVGHKYSNFESLIQSDFVLDGCNLHPILSEGLDINTTTSKYAKQVDSILSSSNFTIGTFGIGSDGHTAGLLPRNPLMGIDNLYGHYQAADYQRITATPKLIRLLDEAVVYAIGDEKTEALHQFLEEGLAEDIPARILKESKNLAVFTNVKLKGEIK